MIEIYINSTRVDLSSDTAVGLNKVPFNLKEVPSTKVTYTNKFKIPKSETNNRIFEFAAIAGNQSTIPYSSLSCKIIDGFVIGEGYAILNNADSDFYYITFFDDKMTFIALAKETTVNDVMNDVLSTRKYVSISFSDAMTQLIAGTDGFRYPAQMQYAISGTPDSVYISKYNTNKGGYDRSSALWFEVQEVIDTFCDDNGYTFTDNVGETLYFDTKNATLDYESTVPFDGYYIDIEQRGTEMDTYANYTVLDLIKAFAQKFNCLIDINEKAKTLKITPFEDLYQTADSSLNSKLISFEKSFVIDGYAQSNIVKFTPGEEANEADYYSIFEVQNPNIDTSQDYLEINSLAPNYLYYVDFDEFDFEIPANGTVIPMMKIDGTDTVTQTVKMTRSGSTDTASKSLPKLKWYDAEPYYTAMESPVLNKVEVFTCEILLNSIDYKDIDTTKKYLFEKLGGYFIVNKISGFNPSNGTTKVELIRIR